MEGVFLYDIDSLQSVAEQALTLRRQQIAAAEEIIAAHVANLQETIARGLDWRSRTSHAPAHRRISSSGIGIVSDQIVLGTRGSELALAQARLVE